MKQNQVWSLQLPGLGWTGGWCSFWIHCFLLGIEELFLSRCPCWLHHSGNTKKCFWSKSQPQPGLRESPLGNSAILFPTAMAVAENSTRGDLSLWFKTFSLLMSKSLDAASVFIGSKVLLSSLKWETEPQGGTLPRARDMITTSSHNIYDLGTY